MAKDPNNDFTGTLWKYEKSVVRRIKEMNGLSYMSVVQGASAAKMSYEPLQKFQPQSPRFYAISSINTLAQECHNSDAML